MTDPGVDARRHLRATGNLHAMVIHRARMGPRQPEAKLSAPVSTAARRHAHGGLRRMFSRLLGRRRSVLAGTQALRGTPRLLRAEDDSVRCVACALCAGACPSQCITVDVGPPMAGDTLNERSRRPARFELDLGKCLLCGLCEAACPAGAIRLSRVQPVTTALRRSDMKLDLEALLEPA